MNTYNCKSPSPLLTIVTVVFNGGSSLEKTIKSVINQKIYSFQYIIIDGGSSDETINIIKQYSCAIDYWISEKDNGIYDAMNKGISVATGEWIIFINAGDRLLDNVLGDVEEIFGDLTTDVLYGDVVINKFGKNILDKAKPLQLINYSLPFCHQSAFVRTKHLKSMGFCLDFSICSDYNFFLKAKLQGLSFRYFNAPISIFEYGGVSSGLSSVYLLEKVKIIYKCHYCLIDKLFYLCMFLKMLIPLNRKAIPHIFKRIFK